MKRLAGSDLGTCIVFATLLLVPAAVAQTDRPNSPVQQGPRQGALIEVPSADSDTSTPPIDSKPPAGAASPVPPTTSAFDEKAVGRGRGDGSTTRATTAADSFTGSRMIVALAVILGLIFALRFVVRRFVPSTVVSGASGAVRVLSRSAIGPRQHVVLLQVGRRVIVVGDSAGTIKPLGEITDPDEVATLVGRFDAEAGTPIRKPFSALFGRAKQSFGEAAAGNSGHDSVPDSVSETREELTGLLDRVKSISRQFKN